MIKMIVAASVGLAIGRDNKLLWHIPEDLKWFRGYTRGKVVVMGRKTWESLPAAFKPLPDRTNVVLSRDSFACFSGATAMSVPDVIALSKHQDVVIIGGGEIYRMFLEHTDELAITTVDIDVPDADTHFPDYTHAFGEPETVSEGVCDRSGLAYKIQILKKAV